MKKHFIATIVEYNEALTHLERIFDFSHEFPEQVFKEKYGNFLFENFDSTLTPDFWFDLQQLASKSKDDSILMAVLNPEPLNYYFKEFGYFNWCKIPVGLRQEQYEELLNLEPIGSPADTLQINSNLIVWASPTGKWAIWCDRGFETSVIGFHNEITDSTMPLALPKWVPVTSSFVAGWMSFTFPRNETPRDFLEKLENSYSTAR